MKKSIIIALLLSIFSAVSCNIQENYEVQNIVSFKATFEDVPFTKNVLQSDGVILWCPGDAINLFYGVSRSARLEADITSPAAYANFSGALDDFTPSGSDHFWAIYPYNSENVFDGSAITVTLPDEQTAVTGTFDDDLSISMACSSDYSLQFYNVCGGIKFSVANEGIKYVILKGNANEVIAGKVKVGFGSDGKPQVQQVLDGKTEIRLVAPGDGTFEVGQWYYIVAFPATFSSGYTMTFYKEEKFAERVTDASIELKRSVVGKLTNADILPIVVKKYLTFTTEGTATLELGNRGGNTPLLYYSYDKINWVKWDYSKLNYTNRTPLYICGDNPEGFSFSIDRSSYFVSSNYSVSGDIMSLIDYNEDIDIIPNPYCFIDLFWFTSIISTPELTATTLADHCYYAMFRNCYSLITAPELPATTLAEGCYAGMFYQCSNLTTAPELPATTLASGCYQGMFSDCWALTTAPELPATTLAESCYSSMFSGCSALTTAPELPATTLAERCYSSMFSGCSALTTAPELPATTLAERCYSGMFSGSGLETAPELPATTLAKSCYSSMFSGSGLTTAPELPATTLAEDCYSGMFSGSALTTAPELPATTLAEGCYSRMFRGCGLTAPPELPATTLSDNCYSSMFSDCSTLTTAPELPATTLAEGCYSSMFSGCSALTTAPELPATTLAPKCYYEMFCGCSSLTDPPVLSATSLVDNCYYGMFQDCVCLVVAPELPATTLDSSCYDYMFYRCSSLNYVKCLATDINAGGTSSWLLGVSDAGTFVKDASMSDWPVGNSGIPKGWTVADAE